MESKLLHKTNLEANIWAYNNIFKVCRDRSLKNTNYNQAASALATDEELRQFTNCCTKHLKAAALFPSVIN
jgi:hypothetical protein